MIRLWICCALLVACTFVQCAEESSEPSVAFLCNLPTMYSVDNGRAWAKDDSTGCLKDPADILNYCRKVYPTLDVRNVVESSQTVTISNWCDFGVTACDKQFTVTPFRCLVGAFQSDALLVPEHCVFDHIHDSKLCTSFSAWNSTAGQSCMDRGMVQQSFAMLQPCGIDKFNGVEFVCCPTKRDIAADKQREIIAPPHNNAPAVVAVSPLLKPGRPAMTRRKPDASRYADEAKSGAGQQQHKWNEHEYYVKAKGDMQKHHHDKISKMMKDWAAARQRVQDMRNRDPKGSEKLNKEITSRFQKMYEAEEVEGTLEKKQLATLHQQRVQAELNERKQRALDVYVETIDDENTDAGEILKALKHYVKAMQKDRLHTINRYKHLEETDPEDADTSRPQMADHLRGIDQQLTDALAMLNRVARFKNKVLQQIQDYLDSYHSIDRSVALILLSQAASNKRQRTTTQIPKHDVAEDDEGSDDDDDDDEDDDDEDWSKEEDAPTDEDDEEDDDEDEEDDEEEDDDDEDSEDERVYDKRTRPTAPPPTTSPTTRPPTTKSEAPADLLKGAGGWKDSTKGADKRGENEVGGEDNLEAVDYFQLKAPGERHAANVEKSDFVVEQAYIQKSPVHASAASGFGAAVPLGIAVGGLTVFVVIVVGVMLMRRRQARHQRPARALGSLSLDSTATGDPVTSPEERHVASMQMNGYENPTYKYFEQNVAA